MRSFKVLFAVLIFLTTASLQASYTIKGGKLVNKKEMATMSVQEHYGAAVDSYDKKDWEELIHQCTVINKNFSNTPFALECAFYLGVAYYHLEDFELANINFSKYLKKQTTPKHFEEAIQYKFEIAERFHGGAKRHLMGWQNMPKWMPAKDDALEIYDEVITALPHHDLAAQALFGKAKLQLLEEDYRASVETYQTLIRRFPKHPLATDSYLGIGEVYLTQCKAEYPDRDFLDLAEINLRKFQQNFPGEERVKRAEEMLLTMQEVYAKNLYETGHFFERTHKLNAAYIYYSKIINDYPNTKTAVLCQTKATSLRRELEKMEKKAAAKKAAMTNREQQITQNQNKLPEGSEPP